MGLFDISRSFCTEGSWNDVGLRLASNDPSLLPGESKGLVRNVVGGQKFVTPSVPGTFTYRGSLDIGSSPSEIMSTSVPARAARFDGDVDFDRGFGAALAWSATPLLSGERLLRGNLIGDRNLVSSA